MRFNTLGKYLGALLVISAASLFSPLANAETFTLLNTNCSLSTGCLFDGKLNNLGDETDLAAAYNAQHIEPPLPATIALSFLSKQEGLTTTTGTFTLPQAFNFFAVKSGNETVLYQLSLPTTSYDWTTAGLVNQNNNLREASHVVALLGSVLDPPNQQNGVPEPSTWAMIILGFAGMGFMAYRRSRKVQGLALSAA
jgi:hypothetical protein